MNLAVRFLPDLPVVCLVSPPAHPGFGPSLRVTITFASVPRHVRAPLDAIAATDLV
jgi:hypothetical protein